MKRLTLLVLLAAPVFAEPAGGPSEGDMRNTAIVGILALLAAHQLMIVRAGEVNSGPEVGRQLPARFSAITVHAPDRPETIGKMTDYVEPISDGPAILMFANNLSEPLGDFVNAVDAKLAAESARALRGRAVLVILSKEAGIDQQLKKFGERHALKRLSLAVLNNPKGPERYHLSKEAAVTVLLCNDLRIQANLAVSNSGLEKNWANRVIIAIDQKLLVDRKKPK